MDKNKKKNGNIRQYLKWLLGKLLIFKNNKKLPLEELVWCLENKCSKILLRLDRMNKNYKTKFLIARQLANIRKELK